MRARSITRLIEWKVLKSHIVQWINFKCLTTLIHSIPWKEKICRSLLRDELPASSIAHLDRGIRVEHQEALSLLFIEIERDAGIPRLGVAESRALDLRLHFRQELRASASVSEFFLLQSKANSDRLEFLEAIS